MLVNLVSIYRDRISYTKFQQGFPAERISYTTLDLAEFAQFKAFFYASYLAVVFLILSHLSYTKINVSKITSGTLAVRYCFRWQSG